MRRVLVALAGLAALQAVFWMVWRARSPAPEAASFEVLPASGAVDAPRDGVLHVWATWCAPCRDELPGLLAAAEAEGVALVALSVDESADAVAVFFGGRVPPQVVRDPRGVPGVRELPATLRVRGGELVERVQGARDWSSPEARAWLRRP